MTALLGLLSGLSVWMLLPPSPMERLRRAEALEVGQQATASRYPLPWRLGVSAVAGLLVWLLWPDQLVVALVVGMGVFLASRWLRRPESHDAQRAQLGEALDFLSVCLEVGAPVRMAVATVAEVSPEATAEPLRRVLAHLNVGRSPEQAWAELAEDPVWRLPARDLVRSARSGTSLAQSLRLHADDARAAARDAAMRRARTVGVQSVVPLMACFLPAFVLIGVVPIIASLLASLLQ